MRGKKPFDKHTFMEGLPILQEVTPTDDQHPAHWWDTNDGQLIRARQNQFFQTVKQFKDFTGEESFNKIQFGRVIEALSRKHTWPQLSSQPNFWFTAFANKIELDFWAVVNKFISYLNSLE